jgi:hypothetical protein
MGARQSSRSSVCVSSDTSFSAAVEASLEPSSLIEPRATVLSSSDERSDDRRRPTDPRDAVGRCCCSKSNEVTEDPRGCRFPEPRAFSGGTMGLSTDIYEAAMSQPVSFTEEEASWDLPLRLCTCSRLFHHRIRSNYSTEFGLSDQHETRPFSSPRAIFVSRADLRARKMASFNSVNGATCSKIFVGGLSWDTPPEEIKVRDKLRSGFGSTEYCIAFAATSDTRPGLLMSKLHLAYARSHFAGGFLYISRLISSGAFNVLDDGNLCCRRRTSPSLERWWT